MKNGYIPLLLLVFFTTAHAQSPVTTEDATTLCASAKIRYFGKSLNPTGSARVAYPGDSSINVTYYGLDLRLTHTPAYLNGAVTVSLKSTANNLTSFFLDLQNAMKADSVKVGNQKLTFAQTDNKLIITPPKPLSIGQALTVIVFYQGKPGSSGFGSFAFETHGPTREPVIWSLSEPYGASDWFPNKDTPADKADSSAVSITASASFVSVSNGVLQNIIPNADGTKTYRWKNRYSIAPYLISLAMTNYAQYDTPFSYSTADGQSQTMPVTHYIYPESLTQLKPSLDITPRALAIFTSLFGPYPFLTEKYGHAQFGWGGGMEHQTVSSMGAFNSGIIAHELAHQWFGDKITCRDWNNIWLNEGFASFAEALYAEATAGATGYQSTMNGFLSRARNARGTLFVQDISNVNSIFDGSRTYAKGAVVLYMLRHMVGDATFFRILQTYTASPTVAHGTAVTADFQTIAEQVSGQKLDYFFREWVFGENFPTYSATWQPQPISGPPGVRLRLQQATNTNPVSFTMPIQIRVQSAAGDTLVTVFNNRADQTFDLPAKGQPTGIAIDPNNRLLRNTTVAVTASTTLIAAVLATDEPAGLRVFPNPANDQLTVLFHTSKAGTLTLRLTNALGQPVKQLTEPNAPLGLQRRWLNVSALAAGRYVLTLETVDGRETIAVLIE